MVYKSEQIFLPFCHNPRVWQTDRRTDGRTEFSSLDHVCMPCSAVKMDYIFLRFLSMKYNYRHWPYNLFNIMHFIGPTLTAVNSLMKTRCRPCRPVMWLRTCCSPHLSSASRNTRNCFLVLQLSIDSSFSLWVPYSVAYKASQSTLLRNLARYSSSTSPEWQAWRLSIRNLRCWWTIRLLLNPSSKPEHKTNTRVRRVWPT